jgi:hypothetical protein
MSDSTPTVKVFATNNESSADWLNRLPEYKCERCGNMSIFKRECIDCTNLLDKREQRILLIKERARDYEEIMDLKDRMKRNIIESEEIENWLRSNDPEFEE